VDLRHTCLSLISGAGWRLRHHASAHTCRGKLRLPVRTNAYDGGIKHNRKSRQEMLRFASFVPHILPTGGRCSQDVSARMSSENPGRRKLLKLLHSHESSSHAHNQRAKITSAYRLARLSSRNLTNIATRLHIVNRSILRLAVPGALNSLLLQHPRQDQPRKVGKI
jgi:hypothetical protein